jgi:hypothetical protein
MAQKNRRQWLGNARRKSDGRRKNNLQNRLVKEQTCESAKHMQIPLARASCHALVNNIENADLIALFCPNWAFLLPAFTHDPRDCLRF